jgi:hypothetical protein
MIVITEYADISLPGSPMRTFVAAPKAEGQYPGIWHVLILLDVYDTHRPSPAPNYALPVR